jgi:hypothetical protein
MNGQVTSIEARVLPLSLLIIREFTAQQPINRQAETSKMDLCEDFVEEQTMQLFGNNICLYKHVLQTKMFLQTGRYNTTQQLENEAVEKCRKEASRIKPGFYLKFICRPAIHATSPS